MSAEFSMKCKWDNSNLYIKTAGDFSQGAAETLSAVLLTQQNKVCRIFVDTVKLDIDASAAAQFRAVVTQGGMGRVAGGTVFFKGEQGFSLAIDGCRVLLTKKKACQCKTPCARCLCAERSQQRREGEGGYDHDHRHCHCHHGTHDAKHEHAHAHNHDHAHDHEHSHGHDHDHERHHAHDSGHQPAQVAQGILPPSVASRGAKRTPCA